MTTTPAFSTFLPQSVRVRKDVIPSQRLTHSSSYGRPRTSTLPRQRRTHLHPTCAQNMHGIVPSQRVQVKIEAPAPNRRIIRAVNLINAPISVIWELLSDYSHLADHIPNLVMSRRRPHPTGGVRLEQCGAQKILGFEFRASVVMDMTEVTPTSSHSRSINFDLVSSSDFREFHGSWQLCAKGQNKTALFYVVSIIPRGLIPVRAIEWRISEDVPQNMDAVRIECERRRRIAMASSAHVRHTTNK